ncbi:hypothetical protein ATANTOWER_026491 [Ataeniobius toweri]|uniref:THAP-type domain-containing protein n=1 Tax=Ataeniobius toweri TaxID=208326 RepID=A0ABU7AKP3_9TELE|nr:hypothetical protein [Ataeniobius toweri]
MNKLWIDIVKRSHHGDIRITTNTCLCSAHFSPDSFTNYQEIQLGFMDSRLVLALEAVPTISLPDSHPPDIAAADVAALDIGIANISEGRFIRPTNGVGFLVWLCFKYSARLHEHCLLVLDTEARMLLSVGVASAPPVDTPPLDTTPPLRFRPEKSDVFSLLLRLNLIC